MRNYKQRLSYCGFWCCRDPNFICNRKYKLLKFHITLSELGKQHLFGEINIWWQLAKHYTSGYFFSLPSLLLKSIIKRSTMNMSGRMKSSRIIKQHKSDYKQIYSVRFNFEARSPLQVKNDRTHWRESFVLVSMTTVTDCQKFRGLKQDKFALQFWKSEVPEISLG